LFSIVSILLPRPTMAPMAAIEINDAIKAYSIAVAALRHRIIRLNLAMSPLQINRFPLKIRRLGNGEQAFLLKAFGPWLRRWQLLWQTRLSGRTSQGGTRSPKICLTTKGTIELITH
jgi:hypothetical protein